MTYGIYLVCDKTKQAVHVSEVGGLGFRGPDYWTVAGAFCRAHFGEQLTIISENRHSGDYTKWTVENVDTQFLLIAPPPKDWDLVPKIIDSLRELELR
jgi:hypothetical protein